MGFENMGGYWFTHAVVSQAWPNLLEATSGYTVGCNPDDGEFLRKG
jgi:hypothetical protein